MMPGMDGYEATRAIRLSKKADAADIPIIALTANAFAEDAKAAHDAGMNAHLSKPLDFNKLKIILARIKKNGPVRVLSIRIEKKVNYFYEVTTSD